MESGAADENWLIRMESGEGSLSAPFLGDPFEVFRINDVHRRPDMSPEADLWAIDDLVGLGHQGYTFPVPTLVPPYWPPAQDVKQKTYDALFEKEFPIAIKILRAVPENLVVAGGAAAWPLGELFAKAGDVDFFVVGIDPNDEAALWAKAAEFFEACKDAVTAWAEDADSVQAFVQLLTPGLLTLVVNFSDLQPRWKFQLIMRAYPSVSALLHAFDVGSACVAYDGQTAKMTTLGVYAHVNRVNLVNPKYRSTTYEKRLAKYFDRHFAIAFPHLRRGVLSSGAKLVLPHITLVVTAAGGNWATGQPEISSSVSSSDYEATPSWGWSVNPADLPHCGTRFVNLAQLVSGQNRFAVIGVTEFDRGAYGDEEYEGMLKYIPFAKYARPTGPKRRVGLTFADAFPHEDFLAAVRIASRGVYNDSERFIRPAALTKYLGLTPEEAHVFAGTLAKTLIANPNKKITLAGPLKFLEERLTARYFAAAEKPIEWWITRAPERQFTASLNPCMEDPIEWYGEENVEDDAEKAAAGAAEVHIESLQSALMARTSRLVAPGESRDQCPLCLEPLSPGEPNCVTPVCGHVIHWARTVGNGCEGLLAWVRDEGRGDCPICRAQYAETARDRSTTRPLVQEIPLVIPGWDA